MTNVMDVECTSSTVSYLKKESGNKINELSGYNKVKNDSTRFYY